MPASVRVHEGDLAIAIAASTDLTPLALGPSSAEMGNRRSPCSGAPAAERGRIATIGFALNSLRDLRLSGRPYPTAVPVLLRWLPRATDQYLKEDIIRTLSVPWARPVAAPALLRELKESTDPNLRWVIANALEVVADDSSFEELRRLATDLGLGRSREMLVLALGNLKDARVVPTLLSMLRNEDLVGHVLIALRRAKASVDPESIAPLTQHSEEWVRGEAKELLREMDTKRTP